MKVPQGVATPKQKVKCEDGQMEWNKLIDPLKKLKVALGMV